MSRAPRPEHFGLTPRVLLARGLALLALSVPALLPEFPVVAAPPTLNTVFPPGGTAGQTLELTLAGTGFGPESSLPAQTLIATFPWSRIEPLAPGKFRVEIPPDVPPGAYDLWFRGPEGLSNVRTFWVGSLPEFAEPNPSPETPDNNSPPLATPLTLDAVLNGRFEKAADVDWFRFSARAGQRVVVDVAAERIDSLARPILELFDPAHRRLAVSRGYFGTDPLCAVELPATGDYTLRLTELISAGGPEFLYRLTLDTQPRIAALHPAVVSRTDPGPLSLVGWNLTPPTEAVAEAGGPPAPARTDPAGLQLFAFTPPGPPGVGPSRFPPARWQPAQAGLVASAARWAWPGSSTPLVPIVVDSPVVLDGGENQTPEAAQSLKLPALVAGQLTDPNERDHYAFTAERGEVWYFEAFGQRLGAPVDLRLALLSPNAGTSPVTWIERVQFADHLRETGEAFPLGHLDPAGRWTCPASGRYVVAVANLAASSQPDLRRLYALRIHREEPGVALVSLPRGGSAGAVNLEQQGRVAIDLLATRRTGTTEPILVRPRGLPPGVEFPDTWLGPEIDRGVGILTVTPAYEGQPFDLELEATLVSGGETLTAPVIPGTVVRPGRPQGWGRLVARCPVAVVGQARAQLHVSAHEPLEHHLYGRLAVRHSPGGIVDFAVEVDRLGVAHAAPTRLSFDNLPPQFQPQTATLAPGQDKGYLSLHLPPTLPPGSYSFVIRAETTVPAASGPAPAVTLLSTPVTVQVEPAAFRLEIDPFAVTRVKRNQVVTVAYKAHRLGGFIGKLHTELAVPGQITNVPGLRGRGETFVGQTDSGSLQIAINADAPLGPTPFLRLLTIGVVEDEPLYQGSQFLPLEVVE